MGFDPVSYILGAKSGGGGGGGVTVEPLSVSENGVYTAPSGKAYSPVSVNVGGGGDQYLYKNCYRLVLSKTENTWTDDPTITIDCAGLSNFQNICDGGNTNPGYKKIKLINIPNEPRQLGAAFFAHSALSAFEFVELDRNLIGTGNCQGVFYNNSSLRSVVGGSFDLSAVRNLSNFGKNAPKLETVSFVPSCIKVTIDFDHSTALSDDSLVSIANGLDATASAQTLRLDSTVKARCQTLMGTVSDGLFTADAGGSTTLADFITTTKGWTLA